MNTRLFTPIVGVALIAGLGLILAGRVTAQTFTTLYSFTATSAPYYTNSDGAYPAGLTLSGNTLYGAAVFGGSSGGGTVFALHADGTSFTNLHIFSELSGSSPYTNSDGAHPGAGLNLSGNTLFGTTGQGGSSGVGILFALNTDGNGFTNLHSFGNNDNEGFSGEVILSGNTLYGTTYFGGSANYGTVFAININGTGLTNLHSFTEPSGTTSTNSDGAYPRAGLILSGSTLYGTAHDGGNSGNGTVFAINTDGTAFTTLHSFTATSTNSSGDYTNSDGAYPGAGLNLSGNTLYGTAGGGGSSGNGTVFKLNTDGTSFANLHSFTERSGSSPYTNSDGAYPSAGLNLSGNTLYGTAEVGGSSGNGTVFKVNTDGTGFTNLHSFTEPSGTTSTNSDGAFPRDRLILSGNTLYGAAFYGGSGGIGTIFSISLPVPPQLMLASDGNGGYFIRVQGTANLTYRLQRAHSLGGPWATSAPQTAPASGLVEFHDLFPPSDRAFYRTIEQ